MDVVKQTSVPRSALFSETLNRGSIAVLNCTQRRLPGRTAWLGSSGVGSSKPASGSSSSSVRRREGDRLLQPSSLALAAASVNQELPPPEGAALADRAADLPYQFHAHQDAEEEKKGVLVQKGPPTNHRKAINQRLMGASTLPELHDVLVREAPHMDGIHASHALYRLAKLVTAYSSSMDAAGVPLAEAMPAVWDRCVGPCLTTVSGMLASCLGELEARDVASSLWACAAIGHYDRALFDMLCTKAVALLPDMKPVDCANIMVAFARFGHYHPEVVRMIPQVLLVQIYETKPHELSQVLWGYGRLRVPGVPGKVFLEAATDAVNASMEQFGPQELSSMLWAFVKLHHYPGRQLLHRTESLTLKRLMQSRSHYTLPPSAPSPPQQPPQQPPPTPHHAPATTDSGSSARPQLPPPPPPRGLAPTPPLAEWHTVLSTTHTTTSSASSSSGASGGPSSNGVVLPSAQGPPSPNLHTANDGLYSSNDGVPAAGGGSSSSSHLPLQPLLPVQQPLAPHMVHAGLSVAGPYAAAAAAAAAAAPGDAQHGPRARPPAPDHVPEEWPAGGAAWSGRGAGGSHEASAGVPLQAPATHPLQPMVPQDVGNLLWAYGKLRFKAARLLDQLPLFLGAWLHEFRTPDLCCLLAGYTNARHYHRGVLEALAPLLLSRMHTLNVSELVVVLWSYGIFQHRPLSEPRFLDALSSALVAQLRPGTYTQTYSLVIKAYANLRYWPEGVLSKMVENTEARIHNFRPDEMASLLYGLSHLAASKHIHQQEEQRLAMQAASSSSASAIKAGLLPGSRAAASAAADPLTRSPAAVAPGGPRTCISPPSPLLPQQQGMEDVGPVLSPPLVHLFHSFMRQCMRIMDESGSDADAPRLHYKVLNSIVFSCLRVGQSPWMLIDYAESRGIRLIQPGVAMAKLNLEREVVAKAAIEALTGFAPDTPLNSSGAEAVKKKKLRGGNRRRAYRRRMAAVSEEERAAAAKEEAEAVAAEESAAAAVALEVQAAAATRAECANLPPPRAHVTLPGEAVSGHWLSGTGRGHSGEFRGRGGGVGRLAHRRGSANGGARRSARPSQHPSSSDGCPASLPSSPQVAVVAAASGDRGGARARPLFGSVDEEEGAGLGGSLGASWSMLGVADGGELVPERLQGGSCLPWILQQRTQQTQTQQAQWQRQVQQEWQEEEEEQQQQQQQQQQGFVRGGSGAHLQGHALPADPLQQAQQAQLQQDGVWAHRRPAQAQQQQQQQGGVLSAASSASSNGVSDCWSAQALPHGSHAPRSPSPASSPHAAPAAGVLLRAPHALVPSSPYSSPSPAPELFDKASTHAPSAATTAAATSGGSGWAGSSMSEMRAELGADKPLPFPSFASPPLLARPVATSSRDEDAAPSAAPTPSPRNEEVS